MWGEPQDLALDHAAAGQVRRYLRATLWQTEPDVLELVLLLTSELVANAVRYGSAPLQVQLLRGPDALRVQVRDGGALVDLEPGPDWSLTAEWGRGLRMVDTLARSWGSGCEPGRLGKLVWFELSPS